MCGQPVYSNENLFFLQHGGWQKLLPLWCIVPSLRAPLPRPPVLPQSEHMDSLPQLQKWQMIPFVCFIRGSKLGPQLRCTPIDLSCKYFIYQPIYLFIYLFCCIYWTPADWLIIMYLFIVSNLKKKKKNWTSIDLVRCCWSSKKMFICMKTVEGPRDLVFKEEQCTAPALGFNAASSFLCHGNN